jgi:hypothetical protein
MHSWLTGFEARNAAYAIEPFFAPAKTRRLRSWLSENSVTVLPQADSHLHLSHLPFI